MAVDQKLNLSRNQLAAFLPDHASIRQFEDLFDTTNDTSELAQETAIVAQDAADLAQSTADALASTIIDVSSKLSSVAVTAPLTGDGTSGNPVAVPEFTGTGAGLVPDSLGGTSNFLRADGTWAAPSGGPGAGETFVPAILDFGAYPGSNEASVAITGQAGILAGSKTRAWMMAEATLDHTLNDHAYANALIGVSTGPVTPGVGYTIYGRCIHGKMQGTFNIQSSWS